MEPYSESSGTTASDRPPSRGLEAELVLRLVQTVDRWYVGMQDVARPLGILGSGRESIQESEADGLMMLTPEATFSHATSGAFCRGAHYRSDLVREELVVRYKAALLDAGLSYESRDDPKEDFLRTGGLGADVRIRISRTRAGWTTISIGQYRDRARVEGAIREAAERMKRGDGDPDGSVDV